MKKLLPILSMLFVSAILISACNSKPPTDPNAGKVLTYADTAGLADFQKWKVQNELKDPAVYYTGKALKFQQPNQQEKPQKTIALCKRLQIQEVL